MKIILILVVILCIVIGFIGITLEKRGYNHGICPHCNKPLRHFDTDSQGGRGYICDECTWVSYNIIDKEEKE